MKKLAIIIVMLGSFLTLQAPAEAKYMLMERYNRPFCDVDKTNKGDGKMCWAATIANMIGFALKYDPELQFADLKSKHNNTPKSMYNGLLSVFRSFGYDTRELLLVTSFDNKELNKRMDLCIKGMLLQGRVVTIGVDKKLTSKVGHALTVYGFEVVNKKLYIFYVDSNDGIHKLYREVVKHRNGITRFLTGKYKGRIVDIIVGLQIF